MRVIIAAAQEMEDKDGSFKIINVNDKIYELFETVGFLDMLEIDQ
jgi:anti-anti-sigma regulatory factor